MFRRFAATVALALVLPATYRHGLGFYRDPVGVATVTNSYTQYYAITRREP